MTVFKTTIKYSLILIALLVIPSMSLQAQDRITSNEVKHLMDSLLSECENNPGCAAGVLQNNKVLYSKGYGLSNIENNINTSTNTVFEMGGLSMHFTAACIVMMEEEGSISFNDPIRKYLPELPTYEEGEITIENLLHHTSGLRDYVVLLMASGKSLGAYFDNDNAMDLLSKQRALSTTPNTEYRFSHTNYLLLAEIVERVKETSLNEYASQVLFKPAGMNNTLIYDNPRSVIKNRAIAYTPISSGGFERNMFMEFMANGAGRVHTTIQDFQRWIKFLKTFKLGDQNLLEKLATAPVLPNGTKMTYALGLENGLFSGHKLVAHYGQWAGFSSMYINFPDQNLDIIVMSSNTNVSGPGKAYDLAEKLLPTEKVQTLNEAISTDMAFKSLGRKALNRYVGHYFDTKYAYKRRIFLENDTLRLEVAPNANRTLIPISRNEFWILGQARGTTVKFENSGKTMLTTIEGNLPHDYQRYLPAQHDFQSLIKYVGTYSSEELGVSYEIKLVDKTLRTVINGEELAIYEAIMKDTFTSAHDGFISFSKDKNGSVSGFELTDYSLGTLSFKKT